jgi:hypothetical protein
MKVAAPVASDVKKEILHFLFRRIAQGHSCIGTRACEDVLIKLSSI